MSFQTQISVSSEIDLDAAMTRLNGVVKQTPVLRSRLLDERVGLKSISKQRTYRPLAPLNSEGPSTPLQH